MIRFRPCCPGHVGLFAALALIIVLYPQSGRAYDAVDLAVDALAASGAAVGIPISENEKNFIKPLVRDVANGKPVAEAMKNAVLGTPIVK
jgi:hypothetical protein